MPLHRHFLVTDSKHGIEITCRLSVCLWHRLEILETTCTDN